MMRCDRSEHPALLLRSRRSAPTGHLDAICLGRVHGTLHPSCATMARPMSDSPFHRIPESDWVARNSLAFAVRDANPASPGHTLVIPKRVVASWFEASREEQAAIMSLVAELKSALDEELHPDGYNVGFNVGATAGQTVMHLHVHVIPRFVGDMDDPRGGVRHAIPARATIYAK
jgi:diadenosine tetraphosphate (Ap4A) HIT family hydrolase